MSGNVNLAPDGDQKATPWRKVAEFSLDLREMQESVALGSAWEELTRSCPPGIWTERLRLSLQATLADSIRRIGQDLVFTITFVVSCLSPFVSLPIETDANTETPLSIVAQPPATGVSGALTGESWGFFVIDRPTTSSPPRHTIEICFYCE